MPASRTWSTGTLVSLCGVLAAIVVLEMSEEWPLAPEVTAASRPAAEIPAFELAQYDAPPPGAFSVIAERPLFSESRRPYVPEADPEEPASTPSNSTYGPLSAQLIGVLLTDRRRAALLLPDGAQQAIWLREGQTLDGWRIETIEHDRATLTRDGEDTVVDLRAD